MENDLRRAGALHLKLPAASKNPVVMYRNVARLEQIINAYNVDIVHVRSRAPAWSAKKACARTGRPFITTFHAPYNFSHTLKQRYNQILAEGARVFAISALLADHSHKQYNVHRARWRVITPRITVATRREPRRVQVGRRLLIRSRLQRRHIARALARASVVGEEGLRAHRAALHHHLPRPLQFLQYAEEALQPDHC